MLSPISLAAVSTPAIGAGAPAGQVQRVRAIAPQPSQPGMQAVQSGATPATREVPDRVLPRGSLLDLSV
jgi:hypothetical protein